MQEPCLTKTLFVRTPEVRQVLDAFAIAQAEGRAFFGVAETWSTEPRFWGLVVVFFRGNTPTNRVHYIFWSPDPKN